MPERFKRVMTVVLAIVALQSCYYLQSAVEPLETNVYSAAPESDTEAKDLVIMLPGIGEYPETFQRNGLIDDLRKLELTLDVVTVNAHLGYYSARTLLWRLKQDVVEPAFSKGYERIHFVGISLGSYGTLLYMREYPEDVNSAILLGPYLGEAEFYRYLLEATAPPANVDEGNIWPWVENLPEESLSRIYLGYGEKDQYAQSHRLLSDYLPVKHTVTVGGAHNWPTWKKAWKRLLPKVQPLDP